MSLRRLVGRPLLRWTRHKGQMLPPKPSFIRWKWHLGIDQTPETKRKKKCLQNITKTSFEEDFIDQLLNFSKIFKNTLKIAFQHFKNSAALSKFRLKWQLYLSAEKKREISTKISLTLNCLGTLPIASEDATKQRRGHEGRVRYLEQRKHYILAKNPKSFFQAE